VPSREKGAKACLRGSVGQFLQSGLTAKLAELRRFLAIFGAMQPNFLCIPDCVAERVGFYMEISAMLLQTDRFLLSRRIARDLGHTTTAIILHTNHSGYPDFVDFWYGWYGLLRPATFWTRTPLQDAEPDYAIQQGNNRNCYGAGGSEVQILSPRPIIPKQLIGLATIPNFGFPQFGSVWVQLANLPPSAPLLLLPLATNANRPLG